MKRTLFFLLIVLSADLLIGCEERTPLTPPNPILGSWVIWGYEVYHLPAWFVAKTNGDYRITPTDTIYSGGALAILFNVHSFTFTQNNAFSELYAIPYPKPGEPGGHTDKGTWTMADSVVTLSVANDFPKKLTYSAATDRLYTDRFPQTSAIRLQNSSRDMDTVSYEIRIRYRRSP